MCNTCPGCRQPWHLRHSHFKSTLLLLAQEQKNNSSPLFKFYGPSEFSSKASCPSGLPLSSTPAFLPPPVLCPGLPDSALLPWPTFPIHMELTMTEEEGWVHSVVSRVQRSKRIDPNKPDHLFQIQHTPHPGTNRSAVPSQASGCSQEALVTYVSTNRTTAGIQRCPQKIPTIFVFVQAFSFPEEKSMLFIVFSRPKEVKTPCQRT